MRLTLRQLQIFLAIGRAGGTAAAADLVALSQSATSAALNELESALNVKLFDRIGKRLVMNDNGRLLLPQARQMLDSAHTIERQFADIDISSATSLQIGASTTIGNYLLPSILGAYRADVARGADMHPRVMIANSAVVARAVANFDVDVGFIEGPCHEADMQVTPWREDELIIVCAAGDPIVNKSKTNKATLTSLRSSGWLLREPGSGTREAVEHALLPHLHNLRQVGEFSNAEAIKHAAAAGLGIACLSRYVVDDLIQLGQLVEVKTPLPKLTRHFYLVYSQKKILSNRLQHFLNFCRV